jgi:outer membrane protein OmpA-like peptidoglycan-associated protein
MLSSVALASDVETAFEAIKKQFPDAQYYEKDVEGVVGGSIRLVFPIIEASDMVEEPVTILDLDKAEASTKGNPELRSVQEEVKEKPHFSFIQYGTKVSEKDSKQLDGLAQVLLLHPEVTKVRIDVYGRNQKIALQRAEKLCSYLGERGISTGRCETKSITSKEEQVLRFYLLKE